MEQAVNTFNKGLQIDTHPMVQGNDTLTDCLNGTLITMSGNEVILQNDMGNRRIDNAFLPAGYEPVGMKEYGGIIYVAAYNPLTGRGQIGSFPSPQRKIYSTNEENELNFSNFLEKEGYYYKIKLESITLSISGDEVLHTGDKFSIYSDSITRLLPFLTMPEDTKNNLFTFQIGIFNSQNEFIDISDKLQIKSISVINGNTTKNYNYYIWNSSGENESPYNNTLDDETLIKHRNKLAINTYSYKMASKLYLRAILNKVNSVSYEIDIDDNLTYGNNIIEGTINSLLKVTYNYNCLDEINGNYFRIIFNNNSTSPIIPDQSDLITWSDSITQFNEETNTYSRTLDYIINDSIDSISNDEQTGDKYYNYTIEFPLLQNFPGQNGWGVNNPTIIQQHLRIQDRINLNLLGSNKVIFDGYRYIIDSNTKTVELYLDIDSYPKKVSNSSYVIVPVLYNATEEYSLIGKDKELVIIGDNGKSPNTGVYSITFDYNAVYAGVKIGNTITFSTIDLHDRKQYYIKLKQVFTDDNGDLDWSNAIDIFHYQNNNKVEGLFITTPIFNGNYIGNQSKINIEDGKYKYDLMKDNFIENFFDIQKLIITPKIKYTLSQQSSRVEKEYKGSILYNLNYEQDNPNEQPTYELQEKYTIQTTINPEIYIDDIDYYPDNITIPTINTKEIEVKSRVINNKEIEKSSSETINNQVLHSKYKYSENLIENRGGYTSNTNKSVIEIDESINGLTLFSEVTVHNYIEGNLKEEDIQCNRVITSLYEFIKKKYFNSNFLNIQSPYACIDWESGDNQMSVRMSHESFEDGTYKDDFKNKLFSVIPGESCQDIINEIFRTETENFLILDYNSDDSIIGPDGVKENQQSSNYYSFPGVYAPYKNRPSNSSGYKGFRRIWMKISEKEYIPIYTQQFHQSNDNDDVKINVFKFENEDSNSFLGTIKCIPHYYAYDTQGVSIRKNIIDYSHLSKIIDFDIPVNIKLQIELTINNYSESSLYSVENINIADLLSISEYNIKSNEDFQDEVSNLSNYQLNCILSRIDNDDTIIYEERDKNGNPFDPLYVYYIENEYADDIKFIKSYKADTFYVSDLQQNMPELKDSSQLYHSSTGLPHPCINSNVILREDYKKGALHDTIGWTYINNYTITLVEGYYINLSELDETDYEKIDNAHLSLPAYLYKTIDNKLNWNLDFTTAQYESIENGGLITQYVTFTCKNIFNQKTIINSHLNKTYKQDPEDLNSTINLEDRWKSADNCLGINNNQ